MSLILFIIILFVLVLVHEFGHFIVAKKSGIRVDEFGFGFPPRATTLFKKGETVYTLNWIPFGGFVKIFGENPDEESESGPDHARALIHKPRYIQAAVMFAGVSFNFILAWLLISFSFFSGMPTSADGAPTWAKVQDAHLVITSVLAKSPAEASGIKLGDAILSLETADKTFKQENPTPEDLKNFVSTHGDQKITVSLLSGKEQKMITVMPADGIVEGTKGIGVSMDTIGVLRLPIHKALYYGMGRTATLTKDIAVSLAGLVHDAFLGKADFSSISGPVGIVGIVGDAAQFGIVYLLSFVALISLNLAVINLIPFPALDGGRLLFLFIEWAKGSRISPKIANVMNALGFFALIGLMIIVTYHDIVKLVAH